MSITQFAMVEELASLVKDNLQSKHLVLAVEEALVNYLQDDTSPDGILELEPMSSYNRLMLHRLADIFGFAHESIGEGDDRHLVLQRCSETSIPSILVSDILWQHDGCESPVGPYQLLKRDDTSTVLKMNVASPTNFLDREAAYMAARERIFGVEEIGSREDMRQKPKHDPVVARRMIAHALGQRINQCSQRRDSGENHSNGLSDACNTETNVKDGLYMNTQTSPDYGNLSAEKEKDGRSSRADRGSRGKDGLSMSKERMRQENIGAAKRMFAHALGIPASKDVGSRGREVKGLRE